MKEILLTSSALILALLALRRLFRKVLSRRAQYALWSLVLLRLLVPFSLPAADFSLLTAVEPVTMEAPSLYVEPKSIEYIRPKETEGEPYSVGETPHAALGPVSSDNTYTFTDQHQTTHKVVYTRQIILEDLLRPIWCGGMMVMACWLAVSNLIFWRKLREVRRPYALPGISRRVYLVEEGLPSPCLFGLFRPAVYLTPAALASPDSLRHVLAHEETHARHRDPLWSLLRGICLVVYWFDPLVWWAALASRTDCELACDEGALSRLWEADRIPYGQTLLSLIPVQKAPGNLLLSATTMTTHKRQLRDRITRIAEKRKYLGTTLFAVLALAGLVCAITFTGAVPAPRPLTEEELAYFNGEFFTENYSQSENLRRQFLTSVYNRPQDIDLFELLYRGTGFPEEITDEERREVLKYYNNSLNSEQATANYIKLSEDNIDKFLRENTGLRGLRDFLTVDGRDLYGFDPLPDYEAWYSVRYVSPYSGYYGFRRLPADVTFTAGEQDGDQVHLYYEGEVSTGYYHYSAGTLCLTLQETEEGGWWFVSNQWAPSNGTPAYPDWEPIHTVPLDNLEPCEPEVMEPLPFPYNYREYQGRLEDPDQILGDCGLVFYSGGQELFAAIQDKRRSSLPAPFFSFSMAQGGNWDAYFFRDLLGHDGFCISHDGFSPSLTRINDYFYLNEEGRPVHLAQITGYPELIDLDGDGEQELVSQSFLDHFFYFRRDGKLYRADIQSLLGTVWPENPQFRFDGWDPADRFMSFRTSIRSGASSYAAVQSQEYRTLYFDGQSLLIYNDQRHPDNHILEWPDLSRIVLDTARRMVLQEFKSAREFYDDWRIVCFEELRTLELAGESFPVFRIRYEFHTPEPRYSQALGSPDRWVDPCYPEALYLVFRDDSPDRFQIDLTYQFSIQQNPWPTAEQLPQRLSQIPLGTAVLQAESSAASAATLARMVLDRLLESDTVNMNLLTSEGGGRYDADPRAGKGPNRANYFHASYDWSFAEDPGDMPGESLLVMSPEGDLSFRFWPGSDFVLLNTRLEHIWLRAEPIGKPGEPLCIDIFDFMRDWYDEAEFAGLRGDITIPDQGQSHLEVAQAWVDADTRSALRCTPGSKYAHTYNRAAAKLEEDIPEDAFPDWTEGMERFYFSYEEIFVPENDKDTTHSWNWAGNTSKYEGADAPEGALSRRLMGLMYKAGGVWRCDSSGADF